MRVPLQKTVPGTFTAIYMAISYLYGPEHMPAIPGQAQAQEQPMSADLAVLEMLAFDEMDDRYDTIQSAHARTCAWLLERKEYKA